MSGLLSTRRRASILEFFRKERWVSIAQLILRMSVDLPSDYVPCHNLQQEATIDEMISIRPIIAGDPSRGALSLDTEANIVPGQHVQFFHTSSEAPPSQKQSKASSLVFRKESGRQGDAQTSSPAFTASSEHGFVVGRPGNGSWVCSVDHSRASVHI